MRPCYFKIHSNSLAICGECGIMCCGMGVLSVDDSPLNNTYYLEASVGYVDRAYRLHEDGTMDRNMIEYMMHTREGCSVVHWLTVDPDGTVIGKEIVMEVHDDRGTA